MVVEILESIARFTTSSIMISQTDKIKLLNTLIASISPVNTELFCNATNGINFAIKDGIEVSLEEFSRRIACMYNPNAKLEFLDFTGDYFDPLFAIPTISSAMKRLSGHSNAILIINGLSDFPKGKRKTTKALIEKHQNFEFTEDYIMRYRKSFPHIEVFFI